MNLITAPYGFVPLSSKIVLPDWLQTKDGKMPPLHDVPFERGICGTLTLEVEAETPIFVRGTGTDASQPFQLTTGQYAIPGTTLRGALRNLVEIVTFSRFNRVNNHRYAVRDLNNRHLYGQFMADIVKNTRTGKGEPMPLVNAGWLKRSKGTDGAYEYYIEACDFAKLEYRALTELASQRGIRSFRPGEKQSSVMKYKAWAGASLDVAVQVDWRRPERVGSRTMVSRFGSARIQTQGDEKGVLVMTGQPSRWTPDQLGKRAGAGNAKHHDFVFLSQRRGRFEVSSDCFKDFEFGHSNRGQQNRLSESQTPNEEWGFWKAEMEREKPVPVFFLTDPTGKKVESFGLAMMYRLPYKHSIHQAIGLVNSQHLEGSMALDFAEGVFGTAPAGRGSTRALKGRVGISHAVAPVGVKPEQKRTAILGAPSASYYPNYVEQDPSLPGSQPGRDSSGKPVYKTWMDLDGVPRGWKRYRVLTTTHIPKPPTGADGRALDLAKVGTSFCPLPAGTKFRAEVDVHNLLPQELGALLWVMDFGGSEKARHMLGMARPLGFGRCALRVAEHRLRHMDDSPVDLTECRNQFVQIMEELHPGWQNSPQLRELISLALPVAPEHARYQRLDPGARVNEFVDAKKNGLALPSAAVHGRLAMPLVRSSGSAVAPIVSGGGVAVGARVSGQVLSKKTSKGGPMFNVAGHEGILHPSSKQPASLNEGDVHEFIVKSGGKTLMLAWIDPGAPPPTQSPPKRSGGRPPERFGRR